MLTATAPEWRTSAGPVPYRETEQAMRARVGAIRAGQEDELVWFVQHPPLFTAGTSARPEHLASPGRFETFVTGRGGQWTYHGPGQLVAYVMLDLTRPHGTVPARDTHAYVAGLEGWLVAALRMLGVDSFRRSGRVGVWLQRPGAGVVEDKVAAVGVRVTRWVSWHGVSLNVRPDLEHFSGIVPCGIREHGVTSLLAHGLDISMADAGQALRDAWPSIFG